MDIIATFKTALAAAAAKAQVDVSGLVIEHCTMDRTWGDRVGLFFAGEHAERAAEFFRKWATRERLGSSYAAQHQDGPPERFSRTHYRANGHVSHMRGDFHGDGFEVTTGVAVPYVYLPCAE